MGAGRIARATAILCAMLSLAACGSLGFPPKPVAQVPPPALEVARYQTFAMAPPTGVPGNLGDAYLRQMYIRARQEGLNFPTAPDTKTNYLIKTHMNAVGDDSGSTVYYIVDIYDSDGRRATRIVGHEAAGGTYSDPWSGASTGTMTTIALKAMFSVSAWLFSGR